METTTEDTVKCLICPYEAKKSLQAHINHFHKMSKDEYLSQFPGAPILSESFHKEISDKNREMVKRPGWFDKLSAAQKKLREDPEFVKKLTEALKRGQNTPEAKENHSRGQKRYLEGRTPEQIAEHNKAMSESWKDPVKRQNRVDALQKAHRSEEARKNHSRATKDFLAVPENLAKRKIALKESWAKPEQKEKLKVLSALGLKAAMSPEGQRNRDIANQKPEVKKKRSEAAKINVHKMMLTRGVYSKLNKFLMAKMNELGLFPEREHPIGPYLVDFCFIGQNLVIEADGDFWHANPELLKEKGRTELYPMQKKTVSLDKSKNTYLANHDWRILRFWERDIYNKTEECLAKIKEYLSQEQLWP